MLAVYEYLTHGCQSSRTDSSFFSCVSVISVGERGSPVICNFLHLAVFWSSVESGHWKPYLWCQVNTCSSVCTALPKMYISLAYLCCCEIKVIWEYRTLRFESDTENKFHVLLRTLYPHTYISQQRNKCYLNDLGDCCCMMLLLHVIGCESGNPRREVLVCITVGEGVNNSFA